MKCFICLKDFDPTKDFYITINERKGPSREVCSMECAQKYLNDEEN